MAASLGSTSDPKELIPGDTGKLGDLETALTTWSTKFEGIGDGLRDLRVKGWVGKASDAFWPTLGKEKTNWYFAGEAMSGAAKAVHSYASTLHWAQGQAAIAIDRWKAGDHAEAEHVLSAALKQLTPEAEKLAKKLNDLAGGASDSPDWLVAVRSGLDVKKWADDHGVGKSAIAPEAWAKERQQWFGTEENPRHREKAWGKDEDGNWFFRNKPAESEDDADATPGKKVEWSIKLAEWSGDASVWSDGGSKEKTVGGVDLKGAVGVSVLGVDGSVGASVANGQFQAGASGTAYLGQASATGGAEYGILGAQSEAKVFAGADASAKVSAGKDGLHGGAEAFAGAKATGTLSADVAGVGAGVNGEAWAGAGAEAKADLGRTDGKYTIGGEVGIGLGLGGKVGFNINVDAGKLGDALGDGADAVGDAWDSTVGSWF
jgi:hypothetical protein